MVGSVRKGSPSVTVGDLRRDELELISWSGSPSHIKNVAAQLDRRDLGLVEYLVVRDGLDPQGLPSIGAALRSCPETGPAWDEARAMRAQDSYG